jgi:hypothetical protein
MIFMNLHYELWVCNLELWNQWRVDNQLSISSSRSRWYHDIRIGPSLRTSGHGVRQARCTVVKIGARLLEPGFCVLTKNPWSITPGSRWVILGGSVTENSISETVCRRNGRGELIGSCASWYVDFGTCILRLGRCGWGGGGWNLDFFW